MSTGKWKDRTFNGQSKPAGAMAPASVSRGSIFNELSFQGEVIKRLFGTGAHVQVLDEAPRTLGVPDLSVAHEGHEYWLELKYTEFKSGGETFKLKYLRRQQVEWLRIRHDATNGNSWCGFLVFYKLGVVHPLQNFMAYIPITDYINFARDKFLLVSPVILTQYSTPWLDSITGEDILRHARETMAPGPNGR